MLINNFYKILIFEEGQKSINAQIEINKNHEIFAGHFPDKPILPGVMQGQIIQEILSKSLNKELQVKKISNMKFMALIEPDKNQILDIDIKIIEVENNIIKIDANINKKATIFFKIKASYFLN